MHLVNGAPKIHTQLEHQQQLTLSMLVNNTKILLTERNTNRLEIKEALLILKHKPSLNNQNTGTARTLKLLNDIYDV